MRGGRPRTAIGTYGSIWVHPRGRRFVAETRVRDGDGRLRRVVATAGSRTGAQALLRQRIAARPAMVGAGQLDHTSRFTELIDAWLDDLELADLSASSRENYRTDLRLHVLPAFEHFDLCEVTPGRVDRFLKTERRISYSRAKHSKTLLNLLFNFALRQDAVLRNPVVGTTPLARPGGAPTALSVEQSG